MAEGFGDPMNVEQHITQVRSKPDMVRTQSKAAFHDGDGRVVFAGTGKQIAPIGVRIGEIRLVFYGGFIDVACGNDLAGIGQCIGQVELGAGPLGGGRLPRSIAGRDRRSCLLEGQSEAERDQHRAGTVLDPAAGPLAGSEPAPNLTAGNAGTGHD